MAQPLAVGPQGSVWVEFLGLPGSGKSELSRAVARGLRARDVAVSVPSYALDHLTPTGERLASKLWLAARGCTRSPRASRFWMRTLVASRQASARELRAVALNWFYLLGSVERWSAIPGCHVFDQGLCQALWSIGYAAQQPDALSLDLVPGLGEALPPRTLVVLVEAGLGTILERLARRNSGTSRLERDLAAGHSANCLERAFRLLRRIDDIVWQLAQLRDIQVLRVDNDAEQALAGHAAAIVDAGSALLTHRHPPQGSRWVAV